MDNGVNVGPETGLTDPAAKLHADLESRLHCNIPRVARRNALLVLKQLDHSRLTGLAQGFGY